MTKSEMGHEREQGRRAESPDGARQTRLVLLAVGALIVAAMTTPWAMDIWSDRRYVLNVVARVPLLAEAPQDYPSGNRVIGYVEPHQSIRVLRMGYFKDFQAFRVITSDGTTGWVVADDAVKVVNR